ncbi:MAG: GYF domain-containing protein [Alphaproteobacteria bacterium]|jgi:TM2 domain-containing membrane protein YozV|nr:GYF domain-containing protein [Alphaproteobacteria bacterium]
MTGEDSKSTATPPESDGAPPPPHPLDGRWMLKVEETVHGPYTGHEVANFIREGRVHGQTLVAPEGHEQWQAAENDPALLRVIEAERARAGRAVSVDVDMDGGSPVLALVLSLIIAGVGQIYNGQIIKGALMFVSCFLLWLVWLGWIIWIWSMIDAFVVAKAKRRLWTQALMGEPSQGV